MATSRPKRDHIMAKPWSGSDREQWPNGGHIATTYWPTSGATPFWFAGVLYMFGENPFGQTTTS
eukprot:1138077-Lingulodinium_polyedra.AAC.1